MLRNGERQVAPDLAGIRADHTARYAFAARVLPPGSRIADVGCGVGYGTSILADAGHTVAARDRSPEAIGYANAHYWRRGVTYQVADVTKTWWEPDAFDAAVCFEVIEHLADPAPMLQALALAAPVLIASVPNEEVFPFRNYAFHHRHYTRAEFAALLRGAGWEPAEWYGQAGPESEVEADVNGRTLVVVAKRIEETAPARREAPEHVAIIGLGPSAASYLDMAKALGGSSAYCDEVWGINSIGDVLRCDRIFHMDDILVQEARAALKPDGNIAAMVRWLRTHPGPIYTSVAHSGYPGMVPFPLEEVLNSSVLDQAGVPYFNSTAAYAIAYAIHIGVRRISLFGIDYTMPNAHAGERGRACCEYWLGVAAARGIAVTAPDTSSLLDGCAPDRERLYGYDMVDVHLDERADGLIDVRFSDRPDPPTAEQVEAAYDHRRVHPNRLLAAE